MESGGGGGGGGGGFSWIPSVSRGFSNAVVLMQLCQGEAVCF